MDNKDFLKLVELLEKKSSAQIAAEGAKAAEVVALSLIFQISMLHLSRRSRI